MEWCYSMNQILNEYYKDNAKKLHKVADKILQKFGGLSDKDYQDFYSLANDVFVDVLKRYDRTRSFDTFLYSCLCNKFKSEITARHRNKRLSNIKCISIDTPIRDSDMTIGDTIPSDYSIENDIFENEDQYSDEVIQYLNRLSSVQKEVLNCIIIGYTVDEILNKLQITQSQYYDCYNAIYSYKNTQLLRSLL